MPQTKPIRKVIASVNVPLLIATHLFGKRHNHKHRIVVGIVLMPCGVLLAKAFHDYLLLNLVADIVGYGLHGLGCVPIIDRLAEVAEKKEAA